MGVKKKKPGGEGGPESHRQSEKEERYEKWHMKKKQWNGVRLRKQDRPASVECMKRPSIARTESMGNPREFACASGGVKSERKLAC